MIIVTGAAGFIGSCLIQKLNELKFRYIIAVDDFSNSEKNRNLEEKAIKVVGDLDYNSNIKLEMIISMDPVLPILNIRHIIHNMSSSKKKLSVWIINVVPKKGFILAPWYSLDNNIRKLKKIIRILLYQINL